MIKTKAFICLLLYFFVRIMETSEDLRFKNGGRLRLEAPKVIRTSMSPLLYSKLEEYRFKKGFRTLSETIRYCIQEQLRY